MKRTSFDRETGFRLRTLREKKKLKQFWIADKLGISANYLCMLESGLRRWRGELIARYEELVK